MQQRNAFIGCDSDYENSHIVIFGAPFDSQPPTVQEHALGAGQSFESYGIETYSPYQDKDLTDYSVYDAGDLELCIGSSELALKQIEDTANEILSDNKIPHAWRRTSCHTWSSKISIQKV